MRTAKEMVEFVKTNKLDRALIMGPNFSVIEDNLMGDEDVVYCFYNELKVDKDYVPCAFALTNLRFLYVHMLSKKKVGEIPIIRLDNIETQKKLLLAEMTIDAPNAKLNIRISNKNAKVVHDKIAAIANEYKELHNKKLKFNASGLSPADELQKYKKLLDDGVITQAEFDAKKKVLLS